MIKIEKDGVYRAKRARSGSSEHGDWELIAVADEKNDKRTVTIFADNTPTGTREGGMFKIKDITCVKIGYKKDHAGQWKPDTTINAVIEAIASEIDGLDGENPWDTDDWGELPL